MHIDTAVHSCRYCVSIDLDIAHLEIGIIEKDWTLEQAKQLWDIIDATGLNVALLRHADRTLSLDDRTDIADRDGADLILSLHVNAGPTPWRGGRIIIHPDASARAREVAAKIALAWPDELSTKATRQVYYSSRAEWPDAHAVINAYRQPVVLIEFDFASNPDSARALLDESVRTRANLAIAGALV